MRAIQTDVAGNVSAASTTHTLDITVDNTAPAAPTALDLAAIDDTGSLNTDNITKNTSALTISGSGETGATVTLFDDANNNGVVDAGESLTTTAVSASAFSVDISLAAGTHNVRAIQTDVAGNVSAASTTLSVIVDTTAPTVSGATNDVLSPNGKTLTVTSVTDTGGSGMLSVQVINGANTFNLIQGSSPTTTWSLSSGSALSGISNGNTVTIKVTDIAGNVADFSGTAPAGISGAPINLGLTNPSTDPTAPTAITLSGIPTGWTLNTGTNNGDGTWTVQTNDPSSLTVTTPADFNGAMVLGVNMTWTNPDGSIGSAYVADNVEAYAPGNPIFALSSDDNLTGSSGNDTFVFAQPIARDVIHSFDAAHDKIDLIGFTGVIDFASLVIADDANGNAVVTMANGSTITVMGVHAADLGAGNFEFNVEPMVVNTGLMTIADGAILPLGGLIDNSGTIALGSTGNETSLEVLVESVRLQGGGQVVLSDDAHNVIFGGAANATLINHDNTISGAGQLGGGQMTLVNEGTIVANGSNALVIDTGSNTVLNSGTLEATGSGGLAVHSNLANTTGLLWANDGGLRLSGNVDGTGSGYALISGHGLIEFGAASTEDVSFAVGLGDGDGTLKLGASASFSGTVSGFNAGDALDFADVLSGADTTLVFAANADNTGGLLTLSDGTHTASVNLAGQYTAAEFQMSADLLGGTMLTLLKPVEPLV